MKYVLVTGGASGIGASICETLSKRGYQVFSLDICESKKERKNIQDFIVDITKESDIESCYKIISETTNKLDAIINCAGIGAMASLIEVDSKKIERILNINLLGMIRINKIFFPLIKENKGRIINISSECGWISPAPFNGPYIISKYAVEAYNDSLRRELNFLGIKVIKIQPGSFKTNMHASAINNFKELREETKLYKNTLKSMGKSMRRELKNVNDIKYLMDAIVKALEATNPKICYRVKNSRVMSIINKFSEKTIDNIYLNSLK